MALASAACILGAASGLILQDARSRRLRHLGSVVALLGLVVAAVGGLGYAYALGAFHQGGPFSRMALVTALILGTLSLGVLLNRPNRPWVTTALGGGEAGALTWHLLPAVVVVPLVLGLAQLHAVRSGLLEVGTGTALLVIVLVLWLAALTTRLARNVDRRAETERQLRDTLQVMNETLERLVTERTLGSKPHQGVAWAVVL